MEPILKVENLSKRFKDFKLDNVSFSINPGYIMGFIGPNGAGKSTTIKLIMNLLKKDAGIIEVFGKDHINNEMDIKNRIGFVYESNHYYEEMTAQNMKRIIAPLYSDWDEDVFIKYAKTFKLNLNQKIKDYSSGMKIKLSLCIALSHNAQLLIMDEPTSGLDPIVRTEFLDILQEIIQDERKAVMFSTHITSDLDKVADYITLINNGRIKCSDSIENILDNYSLVKGGTEALKYIDEAYLLGIKQNEHGFTALTGNKDKILSKNNVIIEKPTIEDIMLYIVREDSK